MCSFCNTESVFDSQRLCVGTRESSGHLYILSLSYLNMNIIVLV